MSIPLSQLNTWAHQGATTSSSNAYASIRHALTKSSSPLATRSVEIFLQGSYANATNIYGDSDVDVVVLYDKTFHHDLSALSPTEQQLHIQTFTDAIYTWNHLRDEVLSALRSHFGQAAVTIGKKSIKVQTGNQGRPSDVIPAVQFRRYARFAGPADCSAHWGVCFFDSAGNRVANYPKYHIDRGVEKNSQERTNGRYKSVVRIFKNLRNYMVETGALGEGRAPSYFIECALHNVSDHLFCLSYEKAVPAIIDELMQTQFGSFLCQNGVTALIGTDATQWSKEDFTAFVHAAKATWDNWYQ